MSPRFTQSFKKQAVEKTLNRQDNTTLKEVADSLGVGLSSLTRWTLQAKNQELESISPNKVGSMKEKRPQD
jgi:transposase-like protein